MSAEEIDEKVRGLYQLAKINPNNLQLQEAVALIKTLRRSQGALQSWNGRYRDVNSELTSEMAQVSENNELLQSQLTQHNEEMQRLIRQKGQILADNELLKSQLAQHNEEMQGLIRQRGQILAERSRVIAELNAIQVEVKVAAIRVRETNSLFGKFSILWTLVKSLFLEDDPADFGKIDSTLPVDPNKPQMETDQASINRSLLDC